MDPRIWYLNDGNGSKLINVVFISSVSALDAQRTIVKMSNGDEIEIEYSFDHVAKEINQVLSTRNNR